jgi:hypothetical protein
MSETSVWPAHVVERNGLRIDVHAQPAVNVALVHIRVPLITEIAVTNESDTPMNGLQVSVRLLGSDGELASEWSRTLAEDLPPGGDFQRLGAPLRWIAELSKSELIAGLRLSGTRGKQWRGE